MDESIKIIRVVLTNGSVRVRGVGWYWVFGKLTVWTNRNKRRVTVAEFDCALVVAVIDTACEIGRAVPE